MNTNQACNPVSETVKHIQQMLRTLSIVNRNIPRLTANGCFGKTTKQAVMMFQKEAGLPMTGAVDRATWEALIDEYFRVSRELAPPRSVSLFPDSYKPIHPGQSSPILYPIQGMFFALSEVLDEVQAAPLSGILDEKTAANLRWLQSRGGLKEDGILDRDTWNLLGHLYETFVSRSFPRQIMGNP